MNDYYVNKNQQSNGDHEVHKSGCSWMPAEQNRIHLGKFDNCHKAVQAAKRHYSKVNGCYYCCRKCHTS
jgi:hypothetical protein